MKLHHLRPAKGAKKERTRVGRGRAGARGKTAGRGMKGTGARGTIRAGFEGGQMPLIRRVPKLKGFKNPFRVSYQVINLDTIDETGLDEVSPDSLRERGLVHKRSLLKVLGRGELSRPVTVKAHAVSATAESAIRTAGGSVELLPLPFGGPRPPARGNQHTNR
jgi:large subunit ribosomal protein L15